MYFNKAQYAKAPQNSKPQTSEGGRNIPGPLLIICGPGCLPAKSRVFLILNQASKCRNILLNPDHLQRNQIRQSVERILLADSSAALTTQIPDFNIDSLISFSGIWVQTSCLTFREISHAAKSGCSLASQTPILTLLVFPLLSSYSSKKKIRSNPLPAWVSEP